MNSTYPDAPRRLVDGLGPEYVANNASVIFSLKPGYAWGWKSAFASSFVWGGHLEGTHGGLDHDSSIGFFMTDDRGMDVPSVLSVTGVLAPLVGLEACRHLPLDRIAEGEPSGDGAEANGQPAEANGHVPRDGGHR